MSKSVSHAVSTREPYITPRATGLRGDIGQGLIRHEIQSFSYYIGNCWVCIDKVWVGLKFTRKLCLRVNFILPMLYQYISNYFQYSKSHVPCIF